MKSIKASRQPTTDHYRIEEEKKMKIRAFMVGLILLGGFAVAEAGELVLRVDTDGLATFDAHDPAPGGGAAFYVGGVICADGGIGDPCVSVGTFHCWGWLIGPDQLAAVVAQEYDLDSRGKIQVQGVEDEGPRAVTGGTGDFRNARGEATGFDLSNLFSVGGGEFIATFQLIGAN